MKKFYQLLQRPTFVVGIIVFISLGLQADPQERSSFSGIIEYGETVFVEKDGDGVPNSLHVVTTVKPFQKVHLKVYYRKGSGLKKYEFASDMNLTSSRQIQKLASEVYGEETTMENWPYICMVEPEFPRELSRGLWVADEAAVTAHSHDLDSNFNEVLSPLGCWVGYSLKPTDPAVSEEAYQLKGIIQGLRDEILHHQFKDGE